MSDPSLQQADLIPIPMAITHTVLLYVCSAMEQSKMLMEMQQPVQGMEETMPTVENQENYTAHTHFTPEEIKTNWEPQVGFIVSFQ